MKFSLLAALALGANLDICTITVVGPTIGPVIVQLQGRKPFQLVQRNTQTFSGKIKNVAEGTVLHKITVLGSTAYDTLTATKGKVSDRNLHIGDFGFRFYFYGEIKCQ